MRNEPDQEAATAIAREVLAGSVEVARFPTGMQHFVFLATSHGKQEVVVRISRRDQLELARDALYWSQRLRPLGVPLPEVLLADMTMERHPFPFLILERLPGRDLGFVVDRLSRDELSGLARGLARIQAIVTALPPGSGYGFTPRLEGPFPHRSWKSSIEADIARSRQRIREAGIVREGHADLVDAACESLADYLLSVPPTPFLHDITTKNVIVGGVRLSGIVDVDDLCFGDPLFLVGLIRMALLANGHNSAYADAWIEVLRPCRDQRRALSFYTALFALNFMGELGHRFNRQEAAPVEASYVERLQALLEGHISDLH